jgi:hypothetical protein
LPALFTCHLIDEANSTPVRGKALLIAAIEKNLTRVDRRTMSGEMVGHRKKDS